MVDNLFFSWNLTSNNIRAGSVSGTTGSYATATGATTLNTWQHCVATISSTGATAFYINGSTAGTATLYAPTTVTRTRNYIGKSNWAANGYYQGKIAVSRIYNRALSQQEIKQNCLAQEGRFASTSTCAP
jgi:hypothetical protein